MNCSTVVLTRLYSNTLCLQHIECFLNSIEYHHLTYAFPELSLSIEHHAPSESVNLIIIGTTGVSTPSDDLLTGTVPNVVPRILIITNSQLGHFLVRVVV